MAEEEAANGSFMIGRSISRCFAELRDLLYDFEVRNEDDLEELRGAIACLCHGSRQVIVTHERGKRSDVAHPLENCDAVSTFPQFTRLPLELRRLVWQAYCPELAASARVLEFEVCQNEWDRATEDEHLIFGDRGLRPATQRIRTVLSVHQKSRAFALAALPDTPLQLVS